MFSRELAYEKRRYPSRSSQHRNCLRQYERVAALFQIRERSADEPERLCGAAPAERDARPSVPVIVDPRRAVGYVL